MKIIIDHSDLVDLRDTEHVPAHIALGIPTADVIECAVCIVNEERLMQSKFTEEERHGAVQGYLGHYGLVTGKSAVVARQVAELESTIMEVVEIVNDILTRTNQLLKMYNYIEVAHITDNTISIEVV